MVKKAVFVAFIGLIVGAIAVLLYFYSIYKRVVVHPEFVPISADPDVPTPTPNPLASYTVLLMGYGGDTHDGGYLTDTMIVAHIDPKKALVTLISIPRDIWVSLPLTADTPSYHKINAAYAFGRDDNTYPNKPKEFTGAAGGGQLAKYAVSQVTGLPIDYFIAVSFKGFQQSIDVLGGVEVDVPHTFDDNQYPIEEEKENMCGKSDEELKELVATLSGDLLEKEFPCRYESLHFDEGIELMDGQRALKFVRSRKSEEYGGDYNRSQRQLVLLTAVKKKVISLGFIPKVFPFISSLTNDMQMDIEARVVQEKLTTNPDPSEFSISSIRLTNDNVLVDARSDEGQYILVSHEGEGEWSSVHDYIQKELEKDSRSSDISE